MTELPQFEQKKLEPKNCSVVLFDGTCPMCSLWVRFLKWCDKENKMNFVGQETDRGRDIASRYRVEGWIGKSVIYVKVQKAFVFSDAVIEILKDLKPLQVFGKILSWIPKKVRDDFYDGFSRVRYQRK